ncbi:sigma-70 family RNA polymerase sigma factor [Pseudoflavitalea sp. G-6-1-2]|uniref:RNA polymerase sigma factor n=1 Tax=Pseudoflavitalea sp. G-6-1-2 TaxID=2728841 RepID=UPI00146E073B|nr:sigma-70 family RNA polymerase sigma factor [Pseudoflavitalea sp. G-6-1-2]NML22250.1 sigma-70 family RNA polymerase sigma factor [Pseudoflavitalea sp. G-6-1-2]
MAGPLLHTAQWVSFCEGDQTAFLQLYEAHYNLLFVWGGRWVKQDGEWIKDQLHDFFLYLWEHRSNLSRDINVRSYLLTAFKRHLIHGLSKNKLVMSPAETLDLPAQSDAGETELFTEQFGKVERAMQLLSPAQKEVVQLRYMQNMSLQEIANHKKASLRTVYNLMHRALVHLKTELLKKNFFYLW